MLTGAETTRLASLERLELLCDEGSLHCIRSGVIAAGLGDRARPGDGVVGAIGRVDGRPLACFAQDPSFSGGSVGAQHAETIVRVLEHAERAEIPVVGFVESGGARMQEGVAALDGYARIFRRNVALSGRVPQISVITGPSAGGGCYSPALTDFVVMTEDAGMFLTGPAVVREVMGQETTIAQLGGPRVHSRNGVSHFQVQTDIDAVFLVRQLLHYLPLRAGGALPVADPAEPDGDVTGVLPVQQRRVYDVRDVMRGLFDGGSLLEVAPRWAPNLVTAFARLDGAPVGVVANQSRHLGGVLDAAAGQKGGRFVSTCNAFGLPLVVLVDTPGFLPGLSQEAEGVIRHGAKLVHAFAEATVPRVTVVLRKAFGGAYIAMNSRGLGADLHVAWPGAQIGIMGAEQAVGIVHRRELAAAEDPALLRAELGRDYAERHLHAAGAASLGYVDEVVEPQDTRRRLAAALGSLQRPSVSVPNIPL